MSGGQGAGRRAASVGEYEKRLRGAMRLMKGATRDAVAREILTGIDAQVKAQGGDFARVAPSLDDPAWVGLQMSKVYGVAPWVKGAVLAGAALLAALTVPAVVSQPSEGLGGLFVALAAFAVLVGLLFWGGSKVGVLAAALSAAAAASVRVLVFYLPQADVSPASAATVGELALFGITTALLVVVALAPSLALRLQGGGQEP